MISVWAHRGESGYYPENTLTAFRAALRYDIAGIELDVQRSRDGVLVVIHDETVDRTTDGSGKVESLSAEELKALSIEAPGGKKERIPFFSEVLSLMAEPCRKRGIRINVELKNSVVRYEGMEEEVLSAVREAGLEDYVIYSTFLPESVRRLKELSASSEVGILARSVSETLRLAEETGADAVHPLVHWNDAPDDLKRCHLPVRGWNYRKYEPFYPEASGTQAEVLPDLADLKAQGFSDYITNFPGAFVKRLDPDRERKETAEACFLFAGKGVDPESGRLKKSGAARTNFEPFAVKAGDRLVPKVPGFRYRLWFYEDRIPERLIYTYCYEPESNWTAFRGPLGDLQEGPAVIPEDGYLRAEIFSAGEAEAGTVGTFFRLEPVGMQEEGVWPAYFQAEAAEKAAELKRIRKPGDLVFFLLSDTHYTVNGNFPVTLQNLKKTAERCRPEAVIHLGDLTDGLLPDEVLKLYAGRVLRGLREVSGRVLPAVGNHDRNYFRGNPNGLSASESAAFYLGRDREYYFEDFPEHKLRFIVLSSFHPEKRGDRRYGFSLSMVVRLGLLLKETPRNYGVVVLSHVPLLPEMHVFSRTIQNSGLVVRLLLHYKKRRGQLVFFLHGHNHGDRADLTRGFPVVSVGCSKLESFPEKKPYGTEVPPRTKGTASEDLWDIVRISEDHGEVDLIRFGAGSSLHFRRAEDGCSYDLE